MYQIRLHGRSDQDVLPAAELITAAAIYDGHRAQMCADFDPKRTGAPVEASCRIDDVPVYAREPVDCPDAILVWDATLLEEPSVLRGLRPGGLVVVNAPAPVDDQPGAHTVTVPATEISMAHAKKALPDAPMLGTFAVTSHVISLASVHKAITARFSGERRDADLAGADCAYERLRSTGPIPLDALETMEAAMEAHRAS